MSVPAWLCCPGDTSARGPARKVPPTLSQGTPAPSSSHTGTQGWQSHVLEEPKLTRASTHGSQGRCWPWISYHTRPPWAASAPRGSHHMMGRQQTVTRGRAVAPLQHAGTQQSRMLLRSHTSLRQQGQHITPKPLFFNSRNSAEPRNSSPLVHGGEVTRTSMDPLLGHGEGGKI